jgi:hypothetical protein
MISPQPEWLGAGGGFALEITEEERSDERNTCVLYWPTSPEIERSAAQEAKPQPRGWGLAFKGR